MATTYNHIQLGVVDARGNVDVLYPQNTADDVTVSRSSNSRIPASVSTLQGLVNNIGEMAFVDKKYMVFLGEGDEFTGDLMQTEINDTYIGKGFTWSSDKMTKSFPYRMSIDEVSINDLTARPLGPRNYCVNGNLTVFAPSCPVSGFFWYVEYLPIAIENGVVTIAHQKWTGVSNATANKNGHAEVYRNFTNGSWGSWYTDTGTIDVFFGSASQDGNTYA